MDFTLETYGNICSTIIENSYTVLPVNEYLNTSHIPQKIAVLRHDVDRRPSTALRMAQLEHRKGIKSTYYFRYMKGVFKPNIIKKINTLGHEIGYHYETLSKCRGNFDQAIALFEEELEAFRKICPVYTVSMHGRPFLPWDNRELWEHASLQQFKLTGECYISVDYQNIQYFSDTGRTWHPGRHNIRDKVQHVRTVPLLSSTCELLHYLKNNEDKNVCIVTHPNRWSKSYAEWTISAGTDFGVNQIKRIIKFLRN